MNDDVRLCFITHAQLDNANFSLDCQNETLIHVCFRYYAKIPHKSKQEAVIVQEISSFESTNYEFITSRMSSSAFDRKS